jgi:hypothetical protein
MDKYIGTVASQLFDHRISWDTLVAIHAAAPLQLRKRFRLEKEAAYIPRLSDTLTEQFGEKENASSVIETFITHVIDCLPSKWPKELKQLAGVADDPKAV